MPPLNSTQRLKLLGETVRAIREARGITQQALADEAGITKAYLSKIELERRQASPAVIVALARALALPVTAITCNLDKLAEDMAAVDAAAS
jgi:transcriptional regulator with XRE-family HTH domain